MSSDVLWRLHCRNMCNRAKTNLIKRSKLWMVRSLFHYLLICLLCSCSDGDDPCQRADQCKEKGLCASLQGRCVAVTKEHCLQSNACSEAGFCSVLDGRCAAVTEKDCRFHSEVCARSGQCDVSQNKCVSRRAASCRTAKERIRDVKRAYVEVDLCGGLGHCRAVGGRCQPGSDTDCRNAFVCREWGRCSVNRGTCLAKNDTDCRRSRACLETGACKARMGKCEKP
ncbi:MAG: hypothetical protein VYA30_15305 [Myxococcota bacterium]|nr:hypothetical protein [Myxococcota bacterium]